MFQQHILSAAQSTTAAPVELQELALVILLKAEQLQSTGSWGGQWWALGPIPQLHYSPDLTKWNSLGVHKTEILEVKGAYVN